MGPPSIPSPTTGFPSFSTYRRRGDKGDESETAGTLGGRGGGINGGRRRGGAGKNEEKTKREVPDLGEEED
jgi:hypothetical protein